MSTQKQIVIKKYQNRRLYNMATSSYITLDELSRLIKQGAEVVVIDAKTNVDLTRVTLTQIILEHEADGYNMLPLDFLQQIIRLYDDSAAGIFRAYLVYMLELYTQNQGHMQQFMKNVGAGGSPLSDVFVDGFGKMQQQSQEVLDGWLKAWNVNFNADKVNKDGTSGQK